MAPRLDPHPGAGTAGRPPVRPKLSGTRRPPGPPTARARPVPSRPRPRGTQSRPRVPRRRAPTRGRTVRRALARASPSRQRHRQGVRQVGVGHGKHRARTAPGGRTQIVLASRAHAGHPAAAAGVDEPFARGRRRVGRQDDELGFPLAQRRLSRGPSRRQSPRAVCQPQHGDPARRRGAWPHHLGLPAPAAVRLKVEEWRPLAARRPSNGGTSGAWTALPAGGWHAWALLARARAPLFCRWPGEASGPFRPRGPAPCRPPARDRALLASTAARGFRRFWSPP